jgi:hypothetical protein
MSQIDSTVLSGMGALLSSMTFLLGFAATAWRGDVKDELDQLTETHDRLLDLGQADAPPTYRTMARC